MKTKIIKQQKYFILLPVIIFLFSCKNESNETKQERNDSTSATNTEQPLSIEQEMKEMAEKQKNEKPKENPYKDAKIDVVVFNNDTVKQGAKYTGYGYAILIFGERQINQPHKPGMPGLNGFKTAADAKKVGEFVAHKIRNNNMPPSVSTQELDSLGVLK